MQYSVKQNIRSALLLLFVIGSLVVKAQVYPVQVIPQLTPPYNVTLPSYTTTTANKISLKLILNDVNTNNLSVRLKMIIKGQGLSIQSTDFVVGAAPINLFGGTLIDLSTIDLQPYFRLENLVGIPPQVYNRPLPAGRYDFCFQVWTTNTQNSQLVSNPNGGCAFAFLVLNDPPILNKPQRGDQIVLKDPLNIFFNWTPRSITATNVSYEFEIRELWDDQIDPQAAFLASPTLYTETTRANAFLYDLTKPTLLPDKTYAWRVRAISTSGIDENAVYKNNGYSEIFHFRLTKDCDAPKFPLSEALNQNTVKINWQGNFEHNKYHVQYRKVSYTTETDKQRTRRDKKNKKRARKGQKEKDYVPKKEDHEWFEVYTQNEQAQISNLEAGVTYEFRVGGTCSSLAFLNQYYSYTSENQFTMPTADETVSYNCGVVPDIQITNQNPLQNIGVNETFYAGDFPVTVKEVQGNGTFSGKGYIVVPYLADTKIAVGFEGISINTDYQLIEGIVQTAYDAEWTTINEEGNIDGLVSSLGDLIKEILDNFKGTEEQINQLEELQEQYGDEIAEAMNNPDIPDELKEDIKTSWENSGQAFDDLMASANEFGEGGPNGDGYDDLSSGASDGISESNRALEKAYDVAFVVEAQRILNSENAGQLFWETLEKIDKIYEFFKQCHSEGWASYESKGLIPYCFWRDRDVSPDEILTESDTPYLAGVFDGIYKEGEAILEIPEMINNLDQGIHQLFYAYTVAYLKCRGSKIQENQTRFEELLNKLKAEKNQQGIWNWFKKKWNDYESKKEDVAEYLKKCNEAQKTREAVNDLYELVNSWKDIKDLYASIASEIKEISDLFNTKSPINEERYKKGILDIQIVSAIIPITGQLTKVKKVKGVLQSLKNLTKNQWDDLAKKYGDEVANAVGKYANDFFSTTGIKITKATDDGILAGAKKWQGKGDYPGVDDWEVYEIPAGSKIYGGIPGQTGFYSTFDNLQNVNFDKIKYWESLQVKPDDILGFRPKVAEYTTKETIKVAISKTLANSQFGKGGGWQVFVDDFANKLELAKEIPLK